MLIVISPAKSLDMATTDHAMTQPEWQADAVRLSKTMKNLPLKGLKSLMGLSDDLARLNRDRYAEFEAKPEAERTKAAALAFNGDTYQGFEAKTLTEDDMIWAQDRLRILSGLYGLLRPLDAIQPYRLEMGSRLKTRRGKTLYDYWGDQIAKGLNEQATAVGTETLINCASQEYFGAANRPALSLNVITPQFMEVKDGKPRIVSFFAKRARGAMARFVIENRLTEADDIKSFKTGGYSFDPDLSDDRKFVFLRDYPT